MAISLEMRAYGDTAELSCRLCGHPIGTVLPCAFDPQSGGNTNPDDPPKLVHSSCLQRYLDRERERLAAAAPDMLRVLQEIASDCTRVKKIDPQRLREKCLAAIALAGGKLPPKASN
jgi:hypothetical protein